MSESAEAKRLAKARDLSRMPTDFEYLLGKADICRVVAISERTLQSMMSSGEFSKPDLYLGDLPRWKISTYQAWLRKRLRGGRGQVSPRGPCSAI
jgi:hypothetical protein